MARAEGEGAGPFISLRVVVRALSWAIRDPNSIPFLYLLWRRDLYWVSHIAGDCLNH